jgi:dolichol-phosphate mannosyltransferase
MRTLVVLPTYNEADTIAEVLQRLRGAAPSAAVLVVDDASPDGTAEIVRSLAPRLGAVDLLARPGKLGLGSAYRDGFMRGLRRRFDVLVEMDSDLSHDPFSVPRLLQAVEHGADLAVGSRYVAGASIPTWSAHRRALSRWGNRYARWLLGLPLADATSGFRAYRADVLARIDLPSVRTEGYGFQIEMAHRVAAVGGHIVEVPIAFVDRAHGTSKMSLSIVLEALYLVTRLGVTPWAPASAAVTTARSDAA